VAARGPLRVVVLAAVKEMDLTAFYAAYRADGHGRAAHDPGGLLPSRALTV
jgi:hypothetical protein